MTQPDQTQQDLLKTPQENSAQGLDPAGKSLFNALRISFGILQIIMLILVILFLASGVCTVEPDEKALVLQFGKIRQKAEKKLLSPGLHWVFPYPVHELIKIPVQKKLSLSLDSFWYYQRPSETLPQGPKTRERIPPVLNPVREGYCITRSRRYGKANTGSTDRDYNIVHTKWRLIYQIRSPERFFKNVYTRDVKPGQKFTRAIAENLPELLEPLLEDSVVETMVHFTIDEAISSEYRIAVNVRKTLQKKLDKIKTGIQVEDIQLTDVTWPRQVNSAFLASIQASQISQTEKSQARTFAENKLNETAGEIANDLIKALKNPDTTPQQLDALFEQAAGQSRRIISDAEAYRTQVVENAKADAKYLKKILPEYRKRPRIVLDRIYRDTIENVFENAEEKMIIQPTQGEGTKELRLLINRNPAMEPKQQK